MNLIVIPLLSYTLLAPVLVYFGSSEVVFLFIWLALSVAQVSASLIAVRSGVSYTLHTSWMLGGILSLISLLFYDGHHPTLVALVWMSLGLSVIVQSLLFLSIPNLGKQNCRKPMLLAYGVLPWSIAFTVILNLVGLPFSDAEVFKSISLGTREAPRAPYSVLIDKKPFGYLEGEFIELDKPAEIGQIVYFNIKRGLLGVPMVLDQYVSDEFSSITQKELHIKAKTFSKFATMSRRGDAFFSAQTWSLIAAFFIFMHSPVLVLRFFGIRALSP